MSVVASSSSATRYQSGRTGTTLKGRELDQCYSGPVDEHAYRHGDGTYVYPNPYFAYKGGYSNGAKQGRGKLTIGDGYLEGVFVDDEIQGEGIRVWADGSSFSGTFEKGEPAGTGAWEGADGSRYEGEFRGYTREGEGTLWLANGDKYVGAFSAHKFHGQGEHVSVDGTRYSGEWAAGLKHGEGELSWTDGSYYKGEFVDDMQHGTGEAFLAATGITFNGEFTCGEPVVVPERLYCTSPPPPDMSVKNPSFPEATIGLPFPFDVTAEVQYKTETLHDKPPEDDKPRSRPGKKSAEPVQEGPFVVTEWFNCAQESGRVLTLTIHTGDLTAAAPEELTSAAPIPFDPMVPDITQVQATAADGRATFDGFMLGSPAPIAEEEEEEPTSEESAPAGEENEEEGLVEFQSGVYTVRIVAAGLQPYAFKLNVTGHKPEKGGKKKDKGGKGKKK